ncbi:MAG TPA: class I SAM-dependent methyltransferase [Candidatus Polarisedimenticolaceae bacterium]|nr:class I SAM-dependent methyltransferase [Candidatus Polarisedimenticolaceae bacterium]
MGTTPDPDVAAWYAALESRHLATLTLPEVRRALQSLSALYVERRGRLAEGRALDGAGKRAAFALHYAPLHFMIVREIVRALPPGPGPSRIVDLGCGTGAASAAWALATGGRPRVVGIDASGWAIAEAGWNLETLGIRATLRRGDLLDARLGEPTEGIVAAFTVNELPGEARERLLGKLLAAASRGSRVLVVEAIARRPVPWWPAWAAAFREAGGRDDLWRFPAALPERMRTLDRAAGLDHRELTARSLWLAAPGVR